MATECVDSPTSDRKPAINFSRPRQNSNATNEASRSRPTTPGQSQVRSVNAFHAPVPAQPKDEYTLDVESDRSALNSSQSSNSANTQLAWDSNRNELVSQNRGPQLSASDQRHPGLGGRKHSSGNDTNESSNSSGKTAESLKQLMPKSILKHTQVEQYSERADSETGESTGSHHTVSESGGSWDESGKWTSSDFDTSELSEKEIKKLEKKGVNPALYAEMKAAKKGKSVVGALTGNSYVA